MNHELVGNAVVASADGVEATCSCGWKSGKRFSAMVASALFQEHLDRPEAPTSKNLYCVAREVCHGQGMAWTDPRTGTRFEPPEGPAFSRYDLVAKVGGDYTFDGTVVASFRKLNGMWRYVVQDDRGVLHIFSAANLKERAP